MLGSRRERAAVWRERLRRYEDSEQTVAEFCHAEGVSVASFYQWRRRFAQPSKRSPVSQSSSRRSTTTPSPAFQQVVLSGGAVVAIELPSGVRVEVPAQQVPLVRAVMAELLAAEAGRLVGDV